MIRFITNNDKTKLTEFYNEAYGKNHILDNQYHHDWQFKTNPFNCLKTESILIYEENDKIISHLGLIPIQLKVLDNIKTGLWHVSFYTLEKFRGKGIGQKLIDYSLNFCDFAMVLSGSEGTKKNYLRSGGFDLGDLNRYIGILNKQKLQKYCDVKLHENELPVFVFNDNNLREIKQLDDVYDDFWLKIKQRYPITLNRTKNYLEWRYLNHPLIKYSFLVLYSDKEIVGYSVIHFENKNPEITCARIVDFLVFPDYESDLIQRIVNFCSRKVDFIDFFCTGNFSSFIKNSFFNNLKTQYNIPGVFNPIDLNRRLHMNFFYNYVGSEKLSQNLLNDINNWFFVKGDSDQDRAN